jgi:hypothetical protein
MFKNLPINFGVGFAGTYLPRKNVVIKIREQVFGHIGIKEIFGIGETANRQAGLTDFGDNVNDFRLEIAGEIFWIAKFCFHDFEKQFWINIGGNLSKPVGNIFGVFFKIAVISVFLVII